MTALVLEAKLSLLKKSEIVDIYKSLNGGSVGFDHSEVKKPEMIRRLMRFDHAAVEASIPSGGRVVRSADPSATIDALRDLLSPKIDDDSIREIVVDEVQKALESSPVTTIEVKRVDGTTHKVEGRTRSEFQQVLTSASVGLNCLLIGPAGCGKTHLAHQVAEALGRQFASVSCTAGMSESILTGWMLPGEGGAFEYVPSDFVRMYEGGGVFLFDEIDAADPNTLLFVNQALANGSFYLPQRKGATKVKRHADFVCLAAANTFGTGANMVYAGREKLDESTLDRFRAGSIVLDYDREFEKSAVDKSLLQWGWSVRDKIQSARLSRVMSTRFLLDGTKLMAAGRSLEQVKETYFIGWKPEERRKVEG